MRRGSRAFSARLDIDLLERLERRARQLGLNRSRLAARYIDEGMRMDDHPGLAFRDGPAGRRAGLASGPDVWEVIQVVNANGAGKAGLQAAVEWGALTETQVRTAVRYYSAFRDEVDERLARNVEEADVAEAAWRRERAALG